jgi:hypothetical protein
VLLVAGLLGLLVASWGLVGTSLLVRHKRRIARGTEWLARSEAWWERRRQAWLARAARSPLAVPDNPAQED